MYGWDQSPAQTHLSPFTSQECQKSWICLGTSLGCSLDSTRSITLCWPCFLLSMDLPTLSYLYLVSDILIMDLMFPKTLPSAVITRSYLNTNRHFGSQGNRSSQSSSINRWYATLMSPNKGQQLSVALPTFVCLMTREPSLVAAYRTLIPWPGQVGIKCSGYCHLSVMPTVGTVYHLIFTQRDWSWYYFWKCSSCYKWRCYICVSKIVNYR